MCEGELSRVGRLSHDQQRHDNLGMSALRYDHRSVKDQRTLFKSAWLVFVKRRELT